VSKDCTLLLFVLDAMSKGKQPPSFVVNGRASKSRTLGTIPTNGVSQTTDRNSGVIPSNCVSQTTDRNSGVIPSNCVSQTTDRNSGVIPSNCVSQTTVKKPGLSFADALRSQSATPMPTPAPTPVPVKPISTHVPAKPISTHVPVKPLTPATIATPHQQPVVGDISPLEDVRLGSEHDDWESVYLYSDDSSLYESLCSAFSSSTELRKLWLCVLCIPFGEILEDFLKKYNKHRSPETTEMIYRKDNKMTHSRLLSSGINTDIILVAMVCRDYLRAGDPTLLKANITIPRMILQALELAREHKKQEFAKCEQMLAACNGLVTLKESGEKFTLELCSDMIGWLDSLLSVFYDTEIRKSCGELCDYFDSHRPRITSGDVSNCVAQYHKVMEDAAQVPPDERTAELATRMINAWTMLENAKKGRDTTLAIRTADWNPLDRFKMIVIGTIKSYQSSLDSRDAQMIVCAKQTIAEHEKKMSELGTLAEALQQFSSEHTCRATGYFSESDITSFLSNCRQGRAVFGKYMQRLEQGIIACDDTTSDAPCATPQPKSKHDNRKKSAPSKRSQ